MKELFALYSNIFPMKYERFAPLLMQILLDHNVLTAAAVKIICTSMYILCNGNNGKKSLNKRHAREQKAIRRNREEWEIRDLNHHRTKAVRGR